MKMYHAFVVAVSALFCLSLVADSFSWSGNAPAAKIESSGGGYVRIVVDDGEWTFDSASPGAPALPRRSVIFAVPDGFRFESAEFAADWETCAGGVRVEPIGEPTRIGEEPSAPIPDAGIYGGGVYPASPIAVGEEQTMSGVKAIPIAVAPFRWNPRSGLLERAASIEISVSFAPDSSRRSRLAAPGLADLVKSAVANPEAVSLAPAPTSRRFAALSETEKVDYLLLSPPDFVDDWNWYVGKRAEVHPDVKFMVKDTSEIYAEFPFGGTNECRNAAESIHAFLRTNRWTMGFTYVVLGGAWFDAQNRYGRTTYFYGDGNDTLMSLSNCVPGVYGYPREDWREIPSDMFYSCLDLRGLRYPWDVDGDAKYLEQEECSRCDIMPDVCVTRITLNPYRPNGLPAYDRHALVTNYVDKLARGEDPDFAGHFRYGVSPDSTGSRRARANVDRMLYEELEFYDNMYNMFDPRHSDWIEDNEGSARKRFAGQFSRWRPVLGGTGMASFTWTRGFDTLSAAIADYYASDRDYGYVYSHGWAQGATHFQAGSFATGKGLTILNGSNGPCDTGYPDYYPTMNGRLTLQYNLGDSGVSNPEGGALASINNTRWGWSGGCHTSDEFDSSMSYFMLNRSLVAFNQLGYDVGHAWFKGVKDYASFGFTQGGGTHTWTLTEQICYGDPLVRLPAPKDMWWTGAAGNVWDGKAANWSNAVDSLTTFYPASNVYFDVRGDLALDVAGRVAAMRLSVPICDGGSFTLAGDGNLRVMNALDVAVITNSNTQTLEHSNVLTLGVGGGVGHEGIRFLGDVPGSLRFVGTNEFYCASVSGAESIALDGGGVTLDLDRFPSASASASASLSFDGLGVDLTPLPNVLRSSSPGGLLRFGEIGITNSWVRLCTVNAFGDGAPASVALDNSTLEIGANVYYQRSGFPETLNATFAVEGDSRVQNSKGGLFTVRHVTTFNLAPGANLTLAAQSVDDGGKIVVNGDGRTVLEVPMSDAVSGDVEIGDGVRLVLDSLPLENVRSLKLAAGAELVLPHSRSGYWQLLPVSSKFECSADVAVYDAADLDHALDGTPSTTGSFFKKGAIYSWEIAEGTWNAAVAKQADKIVFSDVDGGTSLVHVAIAAAPSFAFFANAKTSYRFDSAAPDARVTLDGVVFGGDVRFDLPLVAREYVELTGGTCGFSRIVAPYVAVGKGATFVLAGSHWTEFRVDDGATFKARRGESLDWNADTAIVFADGATVTLDLDDLALSSAPTKLVGGEGHVWTQADLRRFRLSRADAELRIVDGELCAVLGDGFASPYELALDGAANWDAAAWTAAGVPFGKSWSACSLDWAAAINVYVTNFSSSSASVSLALDCAVKGDSLSVNVQSNDFTLASAGGSLDVATLDLASCATNVVVDVDLGAAAVLMPTNEETSVTLKRGVAGVVTMQGSRVRLERPGECTLAAGSQGTLEVVAPSSAQKSRIAYAAPGFAYPNGIFAVVTLGKDLRQRDGYSVSLADGSLWLTPPAISARAPAGTNDVRSLEWFDADGERVAVDDWSAVAELKIVGEPGSVVTSATAFAELPAVVTLDGETTFSGAGEWAPTQIKGDGKLTIADGFVLDANLGANFNLVNGRRIEIGLGAMLAVDHGGADRNLTEQDWRGVTGCGTLAFVGGTGHWLAPPQRRFASTLTLRNDLDLVLTHDVTPSSPLAVCNLSGAGFFRMDWGGSTEVRAVRTTQTGVSEWSGRVSAKAGDRDGKIVVASDAAEATTNKALVVSGAAVAAHALEIETNGCVVLLGAWQGPIVVRGVLAVTNESAVANLDVSYVDGGRLVVIGAVPEADDFVPDAPPEEPVEPSAPIVLRAVAPSGDSRWSTLAWFDEDGNEVADVDWSAVAEATLSSAGGAGVTFDRPAFAGKLTLRGVDVEAHAIPSFSLAANPTGSVAIVYSDEPAAGATLVKVADGFAYDADEFAVTICNRFGGGTVVPSSVAFGAGGFYLLVQAIDNPTYSFTFDGSTYKTISAAPGISGGTEDAKYFEPSRGGQALTGTSPYFKDGISIPQSWTLNIVARMPSAEGGVVFAMGNGQYAERGVALASAGGDRAALVTWSYWNSQRRVVAEVPFATRQFHSYAITSDGATLAFYVDGELVGSVAAAGYPANGCSQILGCHSGFPNGMTGGTTGAIDDWRFYSGTVLTAASVKGIAKEFAPWPECREATVSKPTALDELDWSDGDDSVPRIVHGNGGAIALDGKRTLEYALRTDGDPLTLTMGSDAELDVAGGLDARSKLTLDVAAVDVTNLAENAVAGAPVSRWLMRGTVNGEIDVTGVAAAPHGYQTAVENVAGHGVRLVVTAPRLAKFGSVNLNFAGGRDNSVFDGAAEVVANAHYSSLMHGAHAVVGSEWSDLAAANGTNVVNKMKLWNGEAAELSDGGAVTVAVSRVANPYNVGEDVGDRILYGYLDDGQSPLVEISGIPFARYRVIVYRATDQSATHFSTVKIGTSAADAKSYFGPTADDSAGGRTVSGAGLTAWGDSDARGALAEGVNYVVSETLAGTPGAATAYVESPHHSGRACVAAIQIVEVGHTLDLDAVDYTADVTGAAEWRDGEGDSLVGHGAWRNDAASTVTLTAKVASASVTFLTPTTAEVVRVVGAADTAIALDAADGMAAFDEIDLTAADGAAEVRHHLGAKRLRAGADTRFVGARGELEFEVDAGKKLTLGDGLAWDASDSVASGAWVRFAGTRSLAPPIVVAGAIVSYENATLSRAAANEFTVLRTCAGDAVVYEANGGTLLNCLDVRGGELTLRNSPNAQVLYYGSVKEVSSRHSQIAVSGGILRVAANGKGEGNTECGFLVGTTSNTQMQPGVEVSGGEFVVDDGWFMLWERSSLAVSGGTLRAHGVGKGGGGVSTFTLSGGVAELGAGGVAKTSRAGGSLSVNFRGGKLLATAATRISIAPAVSGTTVLASKRGASLTLAAGASGNGTLICGDGENDGAVTLAGGSFAAHALGGTFSIKLTAEQEAATAETKLFSAAPGFAAENVTVLGTDGNAATNGELRVAGGEVNWRPHAATATVDGRRVAFDEIFAHACSTSRIVAAGAATNAAGEIAFANGATLAVPKWYSVAPTADGFALALNELALPSFGPTTNAETGAVIPATSVDGEKFILGVPDANPNLWFRLEGFERLGDETPTRFGEWTRGGTWLDCPRPNESQGFFRVRASDYKP